jgi:ketosteroid isomerase-like protein
MAGVTPANADLVRRLYERLEARDLSATDLVAEDFEVDDPDLPGAGVFRGRDGLARYVNQWLDAWDEYRLEVEELLARGDRVVALLHHVGRGRDSGVESELRDAHVWTFEGGVPVRCRTYLDRAAALRDTGFSPD